MKPLNKILDGVYPNLIKEMLTYILEAFITEPFLKKKNYEKKIIF